MFAPFDFKIKGKVSRIPAVLLSQLWQGCVLRHAGGFPTTCRRHLISAIGWLPPAGFSFIQQRITNHPASRFLGKEAYHGRRQATPRIGPPVVHLVMLPQKRMARHWGIAKSVKAQDFDSCIRWFESNCPSHYGSWKLGGFCEPFLVLSFYFLLSQAGLCSQSRPSCRYSSIGRAVAL